MIIIHLFPFDNKGLYNLENNIARTIHTGWSDNDAFGMMLFNFTN